MKVIDLLQLLANEEEKKLPEAFWYKDLIFYKRKQKYNNETIYALKDGLEWYTIYDEICGIDELNTEINIVKEDKIEEPKPIKLNKVRYNDFYVSDTIEDKVKKLNYKCSELVGAVNDIIDRLDKVQ